MRSVAVLIGLAVVLAMPVRAGDEAEREIAAAKEQVQEWLHAAALAEQRGQAEKAEALLKKAHAMQARLKDIYVAGKVKAKQKRKRTEAQEVEEIVAGLRAGMRALRRLGRQEELIERLERVAAHVGRKRLQRERHRETDRDALRGQLETMRVAVEALAQAKRGDSAELLERATHAARVKLEGRRDKEAIEIIEGAPKPGAVTELLMLATEILHDRGRKEQAAQVGRLARHYRERYRKERGHREPREHREREHREGRDAGARLERVMERIERLEERLSELARVVDRLAGERRR